MNSQMEEARNSEVVVALSVTDPETHTKQKISLFDLLLNSPLAGSGLEIIRDRDDFSTDRSTSINLQDKTETQ
jgi:hypothetical protein